MAGTIKTNIVQLGDDAVATRNLVIRTNVDGTFTIARGNAGATTQDIITIDANGRVLMPPTKGPCFRVYSTVTQPVAVSDTLITFNTKVFDPTNAFNLGTSRFVPQVPGFYQIQGSLQCNVGSAIATFYSLLGGSVGSMYGNFWQTQSATTGISHVAGLFYFNGTTDFISLHGAVNPASNSVAGDGRTQLSGFLAREA